MLWISLCSGNEQRGSHGAGEGQLLTLGTELPPHGTRAEQRRGLSIKACGLPVPWSHLQPAPREEEHLFF